MQTAQMDGAEKALAKEFSEYLANVSREIVDPISANVARHQADLDKMLSKVADARSQVDSDFGRQRQFMDSARNQIDQIVKESEEKLGRLHSSHQSLLEAYRQRIVAELKAVSDDAGSTVRLLSLENESTRNAVSSHHQALRNLTDENKDSTAQIVADAKGALDATFAAHRNGLDEAASALLLTFGKIAEDVKGVTGKLVAAHDETRLRLFREFSEYKEAAKAQIDANSGSLSKEISERIDRKAKEVIEAIGNGISDRYGQQFASLGSAVRGEFEAAGRSARTLAEGHAAGIVKLQKEISTVRNLLILLLVTAACASVFALAIHL